VIAYLDSLSTVVCIAFLVLGSWSDLKTREVSNKLWAASLPIVAIIAAIRAYISPGLLLLYVISIALSIIVSLAIFEVGFFGGADAKAMICLGVAMPLFPDMFRPILGYLHPFFPLIVLTNSFLISLVSIAYVIAENLSWKLHVRQPFFDGFEREHFMKKLLVLFSAYKVKLRELKKGVHLIPIEDVDESDGTPLRKITLFVGAEADRDAVVNRLEKYISNGAIPDQVWVTPGLPMLVFISFGLVASLVIGDILFYLIFGMVRLGSGSLSTECLSNWWGNL